MIRERFDWPLDYINISPALFADRLCTQLGLPEGNVDNIRKQILTQVMMTDFEERLITFNNR